MANTNTLVRMADGNLNRVVYFTLNSDGSEETALVIYDSSAFQGTDMLNCKIMRIWYSFNAAAITATAKLLWNATTNVLALPLVPNMTKELNFDRVGGLNNQGGSGITGDILLTTTGLTSGDSIMIVLEVKNVA